MGPSDESGIIAFPGVPRHAECIVQLQHVDFAQTESSGFKASLATTDVTMKQGRVVHAMRTLARHNQVQFVQSSDGNDCLLSVGDDCVARMWRMPSNEVSWKATRTRSTPGRRIADGKAAFKFYLA